MNILNKSNITTLIILLIALGLWEFFLRDVVSDFFKK